MLDKLPPSPLANQLNDPKESFHSLERARICEVPVTPFHMGPAMVLKAAFGRSMSLGTFGITQVVIDVESVGNILTGRFPVHDRLHTLPGALLVALGVTVVFRAPLTFIYARLRKRDDVRSWIATELVEVSWLSAGIGAFFGGVTHVLFDGMMHADARPFAPLVPGNPLLIAESFEAIHVACLVLGVLGFVAWRRLHPQVNE